MFIFSFVSAEYRFWGNRLVETQNVCLVRKSWSTSSLTSVPSTGIQCPWKGDRNGEEHPLSFLSDAGPFFSDLSKRCKEQILMWSLYQGKRSSFLRFFLVMTLLVLKVAHTTYTAIFSAKSDLGTCIDTKRPRKLVRTTSLDGIGKSATVYHRL